MNRFYVIKNTVSTIGPYFSCKISTKVADEPIKRPHYNLLALDPLAETTADLNSYRFRRERSPADAIGQLFLNLHRANSAQWILKGNICACFDELSHEWLENHIPIDKPSLRQWLKAGYIEKEAFHHTEEGAPQGGCISPVLANMALDGLEPLLKERFSKRSD